MKDQMTSRERVLAIFAKQPADRAAAINPTSIATMDSMKATGTSFPQAHLEADQMAALAAAGHDVLGFDTVMPKFSIVHSAAALGADVDWNSGAAMPVIRKYPITEPDQFKMPEDFLDRAPVKVVLEAIKLLKRKYGDTVAIIGKVFGPWTSAYNLYGTENFLLDTALESERAHAFLEAFTPIGIRFAEAQFDAGADIILWGDHVSGDLCSPEAYVEFLLPVHQKIHKHLLHKQGPVILHACGRTLDRIRFFAQSGFDAFHFDSRNSIPQALAEAGDMLLTGCVNNPEVLLKGTISDVERQTKEILDAGIRLVSPECAVPCMTPNVNLMAITRTVKSYG